MSTSTKLTPITDPSQLPLAARPWAFPEHCRWRQGRKVGRTVYAMVGLKPTDDDVLIGVMDSPKLAAAAVNAHNRDAGFST